MLPSGQGDQHPAKNHKRLHTPGINAVMERCAISMKIILQQLEETPEELIPGEIVGEVSLDSRGELSFSIKNGELKERLKSLFSKPLSIQSGDPTGRLHITVGKTIEPGTPDFFTHVLNVLAGPEYRLLGRIEK